MVGFENYNPLHVAHKCSRSTHYATFTKRYDAIRHKLFTERVGRVQTWNAGFGGGWCGGRSGANPGTISWITTHRAAANVALLLQSNGETKTEREKPDRNGFIFTENWKTQTVQNPETYSDLK